MMATVHERVELWVALNPILSQIFIYVAHEIKRTETCCNLLIV